MIIVVFVPLVLWIFWAVFYACWWTLRIMVLAAMVLVQVVITLVQHRRVSRGI